jgi:hypothetical protein
MPFKYFTLAVTAASQRELFNVQAPLTTRPQAFLASPQPAAVSPANLAPIAGYPVDGFSQLSPAYLPVADYVDADESSSWFGWGALAGAAVTSAMIGGSGMTKPKRATVADQLMEGMVSHELQSAAAAESKIAMLSVGGQEAVEASPPAPRPFNGVEFAKTLPGITAPLGFFDPLGFCSRSFGPLGYEVTESKIKFFREVELKHGRVGMLAAVGIPVGENFHPLFGGNIDLPAYIAFQETPLQAASGAVLAVFAIVETLSIFSFNSPIGGQPFSIRKDYELGDLGFDPLGLKPTNPAELQEMQTKELNNGRLAMIAAAGMIGQELATGNKLF